MGTAVRCEIVTWLDNEPQPGWVEARLTDAHGKLCTFRDKPPTFSADVVTAHSRFPVDGELRSVVLGRSPSANGEIVSVRLIDIDEDEGNRLDVYAHQLLDYSD